MNNSLNRRRLLKSELAYVIFNTHRSDRLYTIVDENMLKECGWTLEKFKNLRRGGVPPLIVDKILEAEGLSWQEVNDKLSPAF